MTQRLKELPEVVTYVRSIERRLEKLEANHGVKVENEARWDDRKYLINGVGNTIDARFACHCRFVGNDSFAYISDGEVWKLVGDYGEPDVKLVKSTLAVEWHLGACWLVLVNANGSIDLLAKFTDEVQANMFTKAFALAKASAHAAGQSGI